MGNYHLSYRAIDDLTNIWEHTFTIWSRQQANLYYNTLISLCKEVADNPLVLGRKYTEIGEGIFGFKAGSHIVFYRIISDKEIEVIRILHGSMDLKKRFRE